VPIPAGTGTLVGHVVDRERAGPIGGATAVIRWLGVDQSIAPSAHTISDQQIATDVRGEFRLDRIALGVYTVTVRATGYSAPSRSLCSANSTTIVNDPIELSPTHTSVDRTYRFSRLARIRGTVTDDHGAPFAYLGIRLLSPSLQHGSLILLPTPHGQTGADGSYQLSVPPGDYIVGVYARSTTIPDSVRETYRQVVQLRPDEARLHAQFDRSAAPIPAPIGPRGFSVGLFTVHVEEVPQRLLTLPPIGADGKIRIYPTTYHPASRTLADAEVITVGAGDDRTGVDVHVDLVPTVRVSGQITGNTGTALTSDCTSCLLMRTGSSACSPPRRR
jgi:hypothetical protein